MTILRAFRPRLLFPAERQHVLQAERPNGYFQPVEAEWSMKTAIPV